MFGPLLGGLLGIIALIVAYFWWMFQYWKKRGVPHEDPIYFSGNLSRFYQAKMSPPFQLAEYYKRMKAKGYKYAGFYTLSRPNLVLLDPELVKIVISKEFHKFVDRGFYHNEKDEPLSAHLFAIGGEKWRNLRTRLTPTFTSGKMKTMFPTLISCSVPLKDKIEELVSSNEPLDIKELVACFTTDVIGSCAFGVDCNSFTKDQGAAEFRRHGKLIFTPARSSIVKRMVAQSFPKLALMMGMKMINPEVHAFFTDMVRQTVEYREKNNSSRKDFMQLLIELKSSFTMDEISAQAFVFFIAGFETSSTGMTFCMYQLAYHQDIQDKVRQEIETVLAKHNGDVTYDALQEMKYLEQVINESMRLFPPVPLLSRVCNETYAVPNEDLVIENGTRVFISALGLHRDPEFYPEPDKFNPDRFAAENKDQLVPFTFLPFGEGPRICIGNRFGMMQMKVGLITILRNFRVKPSASTPKDIVNHLNPFAPLPTPKETLFLNAERL